MARNIVAELQTSHVPKRIPGHCGLPENDRKTQLAKVRAERRLQLNISVRCGEKKSQQGGHEKLRTGKDDFQLLFRALAASSDPMRLRSGFNRLKFTAVKSENLTSL